MKLFACFVLLACASCASRGYRIQAIAPAAMSANRCPSKGMKVNFESVEDLRKQDDPAQIGLVHIGLMNLPTPVLLEPAPKITLATEISNALQNCGMLAAKADSAGVLRIALRHWNVEEDIGFTSEEMTVQLKYTATLTASVGGKVSTREIVAEAKKTGIDTTDYASELSHAVLVQSVAKLLAYLEAAQVQE